MTTVRHASARNNGSHLLYICYNVSENFLHLFVVEIETTGNDLKTFLEPF